jgi:DNA-binding beta-propeller fold protein YncE
MRRFRRRVAIAWAVAAVALGLGSVAVERRTLSAAAPQAPLFEVDPMWPKPLPNHWVIGWATGVTVDAQDHIWIVHQANKLAPGELFGNAGVPGSCCFAAPPVLEFDQAGNLISHWGGPGEGYDWHDSPHGISLDYKGNVWIAGNGKGASHILKFTRAGKFLLQIGRPNQKQDSNDVQNLNLATDSVVDPATNEVYVSDGYGNRRVIVYDADTGKYKRHWGAYGHKPDDTNLGPYNPDAPVAQQFRTPVHCVKLSLDGLLYVCDRTNNRIQVFRKDGTFIKEEFYARRTLGFGTVFDIAFSKDPQQSYIFEADGSNNKIYVIQRDTLRTLTSFGDGGRQPGQFYAVHNLATDSKGNVFTVETQHGQRLQKFAFRGMGPVSKEDQGVVWPKSAKSPL